MPPMPTQVASVQLPPVGVIVVGGGLAHHRRILRGEGLLLLIVRPLDDGLDRRDDIGTIAPNRARSSSGPAALANAPCCGSVWYRKRASRHHDGAILVGV